MVNVKECYQVIARRYSEQAKIQQRKSKGMRGKQRVCGSDTSKYKRFENICVVVDTVNTVYGGVSVENNNRWHWMKWRLPIWILF